MAGAGPSGVAAGAAGFTTIYPVTECMEVGEGELALVGILKSQNIFLKKVTFQNKWKYSILSSEQENYCNGVLFKNISEWKGYK